MLAAEEGNIENVKERSMDEGADRLSVLTICSDLTAHSVQFRGPGVGRAGSTCLLCFNVTR